MQFFSHFAYIEGASSFTRNQMFWEHRGLLGFFGTVQFTGGIFVRFVKGFRLCKMDFFDVSSWEKSGFRVLCVSLRVFLAL